MTQDWSFLQGDGSAGIEDDSGSLWDGLSSETPEEWEWKPLERMEASVQESFGSLWGAASALADVVGLDSARDWAADRSEELFSKAAEKEIVRTNFREIDSPLDAGKYTVELITSFVPDLAMMFAGGAGLGSMAGKAVAKGYGAKAMETMLHKGFSKNLKNVVKELGEDTAKDKLYKEAASRTARDAARLVGVSGMEGLQGTGQAFLEDREKRGDEANPWAAFAVGGAQSTISMFNPLNKVLAGRLPKGKASILQMTGGEAAEEMGQEIPAMMHEAGIDPDLTFAEIIQSEDGRMRLVESGVAGALLGTTFGGGLKAATGGFAKTPEKTKEDVKTSVLDNPESVLEEAGVDTSQDAVDPTKPQEASVESTVQTAFDEKRKARQQANRDRERQELMRKSATYQAPVEPTQEELTEAYQPELPEPIKQQFDEERTQAIKEDIFVRQQEKVTAEPGPDKPQYLSDPEMQRKIKAAKAIREAGEWDEDTRQLVEEKVKKPKPLAKKKKVKDAAKVIVDMKAGNKPKVKVKVMPETELKAEETVEVDPKVAEQLAVLDDAPIEKTSVVPDESQTVAQEKDETVVAREKREAEIAQAASQVEVLESEETVKKGKDGWEYKYNTVEDGSTAKTYRKGNAIVFKVGDKFQMVLNEDGTRNDRGLFKKLADVKKAYEDGQSSEDFYGKKTTARERRAKEPMTPEQQKLFEGIDLQKLIDKVVSKSGATGQAGVEEAAVEGILDAAKTFKEGKGVKFENYAVGIGIGAVQDFYKDPKHKMEMNVSASQNQEGDAATANDKIQDSTKGLADAASSVAPLGKKKTVKKEAPPVKKISVEEYKREKELEAKRDADKQAKKELDLSKENLKGMKVNVKYMADNKVIETKEDASSALKEINESIDLYEKILTCVSK